MRPELVIFDLDGVLVDSERLAVVLLTETLHELGWPLTAAEVAERFVGSNAADMAQEIGEAIGRPVDWASEFDPRYRAAFAAGLRAMPGAHETLDLLDEMDLPYCLASSSSHEQINLKLSLTDLATRFAGATFSGEEVARPKPAPDLFWHAAARRAVAAGSCVVVEDSRAGVRAARAAGMRTLALASPYVDPADTSSLGAEPLARLRDLPALLGGTRG